MFVCTQVCSRRVLIISLHVHWLWISLLIEFSSKTDKRNITKKLVRYLCFISVDFIHSCHHCLKMTYLSNCNIRTNLCIALYCILLYWVVLNCIVLLIYCYVDIIQYNAMHKFVGVLDNPPKWVALVWRKTDFGQSIWPAGDQTTAFTILNCLEYEFLKGFLVQERQQSFWKFSILSNIPDLQWCRQNKWKIHSQLFAMFTCRDGKGGKLSSQASKMLYKPPGAVYIASYKELLDQSDCWTLFVQLWNYTDVN